MNFVAAIKGTELAKNKLLEEKKELEAKISGMDQTLAILREQNTVCEKCAGAKGSEYRLTAECDREWHACTACGGTGKEKKRSQG